jgi:hypothetical protein
LTSGRPHTRPWTRILLREWQKNLSEYSHQSFACV